MKRRVRRVKAWAAVGSHDGIFEFVVGPVAEKYPNLMHVFSKKIMRDLVPVTILVPLTKKRKRPVSKL